MQDHRGYGMDVHARHRWIAQGDRLVLFDDEDDEDDDDDDEYSEPVECQVARVVMPDGRSRFILSGPSKPDASALWDRS